MKTIHTNFRLLSVTLILALGLLLRLWHLDAPLGDWHSFRQADTASVTREFAKNGIDLLRPQYHDLSNIQSGEDNLEGWRMVELPFVNAAIAAVLRAAPQLDLVTTSRFFSVMAGLLAALGFYFWTSKRDGFTVGLIALLLWSVLPYSVFYGRVILPEPFLLLMGMAVLLSADLYSTRKNWPSRLLALLLFFAAGSLTLLLKPMGAIFIVPALAASMPDKWPKGKYLEKWFIWALLAIVAGLTLAPLLWWREWIEQFPSGIPASDWLFNSDAIRWRPAWWRWLFGDRLGHLILGYWLTPFFGLGLLWRAQTVKSARQWLEWIWEQRTLISWLGVAFVYLSLFATGNVRHDYYQIILIPLIVWMVARGLTWAAEAGHKAEHGLLTTFVLIGISLAGLAFSADRVIGYYQINNGSMVEAGQAVDRLVPPDGKVIAPQFGDTSFLFQTNRRGWPIGFEIPDKIELGAQYYVNNNLGDPETVELEQAYTVLEKTNSYIVIDLTRPK